MKTKTDN